MYYLRSSHFTTSTIFSPNACWIRAMVLQVKLWLNIFVRFWGTMLEKLYFCSPKQKEYHYENHIPTY